MAWRKPLKARWQALAPREQRGLGLAAVLVGLALLWSVALAPALRTLRGVEAQNIQLGTTAERMQALQARAKLLQAKPLTPPGDTLKALQAATTALGKQATLQVLGEQATVTVRQASALSLANWLAPEAGAVLSPSEAHLQRDAGSAEALWSGTLVFRLPGLASAQP
jgi:general secretion pathway protein M